MKRAYVVVDSTANIPEEIVRDKGIYVIPLTVTFEGRSYKDGVELSQNELLHMLKQGNELPKTSQVNPQSFYEFYDNLAKEECEIISIHISSGLSGTYQSALIAKEMLGNENIHVIDSKSVSFGTGLLALEAVKMIEKGMEVSLIVNKLEELSNRVRVAFAIDTLEYIKKGGRISTVNAAIGTLLNVKPILHMVDGKIEIYEKVRGSKKAQRKLIDYLHKEGIDKNFCLGVGNVDGIEDMMELKKIIENEFEATGIYTADVGSIIATYSGPGVVGVFFISAKQS